MVERERAVSCFRHPAESSDSPVMSDIIEGVIASLVSIYFHGASGVTGSPTGCTRYRRKLKGKEKRS